MTNDELYEVVRKVTIDRCEAAKASGKLFERGHWVETDIRGDGSTRTFVCAVGAIAVNGDEIDCSSDGGVLRTGKAYLMAGKVLAEAGVPENLIGLIIDNISAGFECSDVYSHTEGLEVSGNYSAYLSAAAQSVSLEDFIESELTWKPKSAIEHFKAYVAHVDLMKRFYDLGQEIARDYAHYNV